MAILKMLCYLWNILMEDQIVEEMISGSFDKQGETFFE